MRQFWVVGGEYKGRDFSLPAAAAEAWFGPYPTYEAAKEEWARRAWGTVDEAQVRYRIETIDPDQPPPCTD